MKREFSISGKLVLPLKEGESALIQQRSRYIRTSPVVEILEESDDFVCFETVNSVYRVSMKPVTNMARAILPQMLLMCA